MATQTHLGDLTDFYLSWLWSYIWLYFHSLRRLWLYVRGLKTLDHPWCDFHITYSSICCYLVTSFKGYLRQGPMLSIYTIDLTIMYQDTVGGAASPHGSIRGYRDVAAYRDTAPARCHDCSSGCWSGASVCCQQIAGSSQRSPRPQPALHLRAAPWSHTGPAGRKKEKQKSKSAWIT